MWKLRLHSGWLTSSNNKESIVSNATSYLDFLSQVKADRVRQVTLLPEAIEYTAETDAGLKTFQTTVTGDRVELIELLQERNITYNIRSDETAPWLSLLLGLAVPALALAGTWSWLMRQSEDGSSSSDFGFGAFGAGKSKARTYAKGDADITFADVAGVKEAKEELMEVVDFLKNPDKYTDLGAKIPKGVLLVGPPGTGKTLLAKAVAGQAGVPFLSMSGSEFVEVYVGVGASRVRDLFAKAKRQSPCIVFIDELDAIGKARSSNPLSNGGNDEREQTLNQLLVEMDGFGTNSGVILIGATNRPEILDSALRRPGRFDRQILVDRPDKSGRVDILKVHSRDVKIGSDVNLDKIATETAGFTGADLANLVNEAALISARRNLTTVGMAEFNSAFERVVGGMENKARVLNAQEKKTVAYHEVGHALVGAKTPGGGKVTKISIVPRGAAALGYTMQSPEEDRFLLMEAEIGGQIATLLGGRVAEEIVFEAISTGASDDIQKATDLAERAIAQYGMNSTLGPVAFDRSNSQFLNDGSQRRQISDEVAQQIDRQIKATIDRGYETARQILTDNRSLLTQISELLLEKEVLEGDELQALLLQAV
jgi:cell division protease FtsH